MSNTANDLVREDAKYWAEECTNSMLGSQLDKAIQEDDLDRMYELSQEARQLFHALEIRELNDVF